MDENKTTNTNPESGAGAKTFTQEDVNRIVGERLAAEKRKGEAALAEREQELNRRELLLNAKAKMTTMGLPLDLLDVLNISDEESMEKALITVKAVIDKIKAEAPKPFTIHGAKPAESGRSVLRETGTDSQIRKAMGLS